MHSSENKGNANLKNKKVNFNKEVTIVGPRLERSKAKQDPLALAYQIYNLRRNQIADIGPLVVVVENASLGRRLADDIEFFLAGELGGLVSKFFLWEVLPFDNLSPTQAISAERLSTLSCLAQGKSTIAVVEIAALMQFLLPVSDLLDHTLSIEVGQSLDRDNLVAKLDRAGYVRSSIVEEQGQMAVRGAIVDLFPPETLYPIRLELFANNLQSLRTFDLGTQRSLSALSSFTIIPVSELLLPEPDQDQSNSVAKIIARLRGRVSELEIPLRRIAGIEEALSTNSSESGMEHLLPLLSNTCATFWDYLPPNTKIALYDPPALTRAADEMDVLIFNRAEKAKEEGRLFPAPETAYQRGSTVVELLEKSSTFFFNRMDIHTSLSELLVADPVVGLPNKLFSEVYDNNNLRLSLQASRHQQNAFLPLADEIAKRQTEGLVVGIVVSHSPRIRRISDLLESYSIVHQEFKGSFFEWRRHISQISPTSGVVWILNGSLSSGLRVPDAGFVLINENEIFIEIKGRRKTSSTSQVRRFLGSVSQFQENDYIVHLDHGIGLYRGLTQLTIEGKIGDFLLLEYAEGAKLFLPVDNIGKVQKYIGAEGANPTMSKLGGKAWAKNRKKVQENVAELAGQLLNLYAQREITEGVSFGEMSSDEIDFADTFPFEETPDQSAAIADVLKDMASPKPMDRLVCGDVGYGKTEVAIRAAFKALINGKQVALLVPTTVLADQHFSTFKARFAEYPFVVACISRFFPGSENKSSIEKLAKGKVDLIIGTHRLLQKDVVFHDLGLVIIDEEHRFGVAHKEKLKRFRKEVEVLTLTATPIPRTLHMSLFGIRDLSVIETPPIDRQVIRTYISTYENSIVQEAIQRELGRQGQVFYIHNRVKNIAMVADQIAELVPKARIEFAHGQMKDRELEQVMHRFVTGEIDVLVSTTIVESGLDIPNANTIIIAQADKFGLAELYQLRGRVGRSARRAYAYLLISDPKTMGDQAKKRLEVLRSLDDLGMGFRLALQDMEIRGAGNLLGKDQSGHINLVGYELYSRILKDAVRELKATRSRAAAEELINRPLIDPEINIGFPAHIPTDYIPDVAERLLLYQRLIELNDAQAGQEIGEEIEDRFGNMPEEVHILISLMEFRGLLRRGGVVSASYRNAKLNLSFHPQLAPNSEVLLKLVKDSKSRMRLSPTMVLSIEIDQNSIETPRDLSIQVEDLFNKLGISYVSM